jgi:hypothetical protein
MNIVKQIKFLSWLLLKHDIKMLVKWSLTGKSFYMIPFKTLANAAYDKNAIDKAWMYAFVNKSKHMYQMIFYSYEELLDAIFDADEIWYGTERFKNMFYNLRNEMLVEWDLAGNP